MAKKIRKFSREDIEKRFLGDLESGNINREGDIVEMGADDEISKWPPPSYRNQINKSPRKEDKIKKIDDFKEDWEEEDESDEYTFLRNLQMFLNKKSAPKKSTRKFLKMAYDLVNQGEVSIKTLKEYIEQENINPKIFSEYKGKMSVNKSKKLKKSDAKDEPGEPYDIEW